MCGCIQERAAAAEARAAAAEARADQLADEARELRQAEDGFHATMQGMSRDMQEMSRELDLLRAAEPACAADAPTHDAAWRVREAEVLTCLVGYIKLCMCPDTARAICVS